MAIQEILSKTRQKMEKALEVFMQELRSIRTGRASPALIENVKVECYGAPTPLKQIATISVPEPRMLFIRPFDPSTIEAIQKALLKQDIGSTPEIQGNILRLAIPPLSQDQRTKMVALASKLAEGARTSLRNIRRDANKEIEDQEKQKLISEDEKFRSKNEVQKLIDKYEEKITQLLEKKRSEIMQG
jgi:ribosome recycling factor